MKKLRETQERKVQFILKKGNSLLIQKKDSDPAQCYWLAKKDLHLIDELSKIEPSGEFYFVGSSNTFDQLQGSSLGPKLNKRNSEFLQEEVKIDYQPQNGNYTLEGYKKDVFNRCLHQNFKSTLAFSSLVFFVMGLLIKII